MESTIEREEKREKRDSGRVRRREREEKREKWDSERERGEKKGR